MNDWMPRWMALALLMLRGIIEHTKASQTQMIGVLIVGIVELQHLIQGFPEKLPTSKMQ